VAFRPQREAWRGLPGLDLCCWRQSPRSRPSEPQLARWRAQFLNYRPG
jgi:hypothetical protein